MTVDLSNIDKIISEIKKPRDENGNKGTFGTLAAFVGSDSYRGCALLACSAALRSGCGIVKLVSAEKVCAAAVGYCPEITLCVNDSADYRIEKALEKASAVLCGCGLCVGRKTYLTAEKIAESDIPCVFDADALNSIAVYGNDSFSYGNNEIITPHVGEMSRLTGYGIDYIKKNRVEVASEYAAKHGITVVLKDSVTVISDGGRTDILNMPNSGMAKGGSGDVLAGIISSLLARGYRTMEAALLGASAHAVAGDICRKKYGGASMLPSDIVNEIKESKLL